MSNNDAQVITLNNMFFWQKRVVYEMQYIRNINSTTITDFQIKVSYDTWDNIFQGSDVNIIFNNFLNTYLRIFCSSFIKKRTTFYHNYNPWITRTRILCNKKRGFMWNTEWVMTTTLNCITNNIVRYYLKLSELQKNYTMIKWFWTLKIKWKLQDDY